MRVCARVMRNHVCTDDDNGTQVTLPFLPSFANNVASDGRYMLRAWVNTYDSSCRDWDGCGQYASVRQIQVNAVARGMMMSTLA